MRVNVSCIIICLTLVAKIAAQNSFPVQSKHSATKQIVNIKVTQMDGTQALLSDILTDDKNYIISLMASWCGPCRTELNAFQKISEKWECDLNTKIIAISIEKPTDTHKLFNLVKKQKWTMPVVHDKMAYTSRELGVFDIPQTYLINKQREIVHSSQGFHSRLIEQYETEILKLQ